MSLNFLIKNKLFFYKRTVKTIKFNIRIRRLYLFYELAIYRFSFTSYRGIGVLQRYFTHPSALLRLLSLPNSFLLFLVHHLSIFSRWLRPVLYFFYLLVSMSVPIFSCLCCFFFHFYFLLVISNSTAHWLVILFLLDLFGYYVLSENFQYSPQRFVLFSAFF